MRLFLRAERERHRRVIPSIIQFEAYIYTPIRSTSELRRELSSGAEVEADTGV